MDMTGHDKHEAINVRICNSSPIINATSGGNVNKSERHLQIREVNNVSGSVSNDVLLNAHQGRNSNRKSYNSINSGNGGVLNDNQVIVSEPINKGKGKIVSTDSNGSRKSDGGPLTVPINTLSSLSKTIEGFLEGGRPSSLSKTIGGFLEGGRPSCSKSSGGVASKGQSFDRISDKANNTSGLKALNAGGHRTSEKVDESGIARGGACLGATRVECIFGQSQSGIDFVKLLPFKLDLHGSGGVSKPGQERARMRVKDVARNNNTSGGIGYNDGNSSINKKPKRSLEVRDAVQYSFGCGSFLPTTVQDKIHSNSGVEQGSNCKENGNATR
ncbi:uncharacterized protein LOC113299110 isoform X3 [Papaver somniferum]|uniref:uncharacterized protein LOC113299110 isoform X3 n=1 Tax=Papaver somniferum TaxID=3469 RepID=UPI000E6FEEC9|nr:uncharacterized protein LOC113299110 isoform X3 [Papaver somniferum]XP_026403842.1 uncharacterized protein LOC113299110 isoform X3 [Papaver somniferum]